MTRREVARHAARCADPGCGHQIEYVIVVDLTAVEEQLADIRRALTRMGADMSELDDKLTGIEQAEAAEEVDLDRVLADLEAKQTAGTLTPEEAARLDAIQASIAAEQAKLDAVDPPPAPTA